MSTESSVNKFEVFGSILKAAWKVMAAMIFGAAAVMTWVYAMESADQRFDARIMTNSSLIEDTRKEMNTSQIKSASDMGEIRGQLATIILLMPKKSSK